MDKRAWTARGEVTDADKVVIRGLAEKNKVASRIFVTGEVHEDYIGEAAYRLLININDTLYKNGAGCEPLFTETRSGTIRMTRFEPKAVWECFDPDTLVSLISAEAGRLCINIDPWAMNHFDFYQAMVAYIREDKGDYWLPVTFKGSDINTYYNAVYLSALLLFGKPGYMDVPVAEHFAYPLNAAFLGNTEWNGFNEAQREEADKLRKEYGNINGLTNPELNFIVSLYEGR